MPGASALIPTSGRALRIGRLVGWTAVAASLAFIGLQLWDNAPWQLAGAHLQALTAATIGGALLYGVAGFLLSSAWYQLLRPGGGATASLSCHHAVYGRTQIAKYLPGNVFHLVGRQVMGGRLGHGQARLAFASLLEALLLVLTAAALSLPMAWRWFDGGLLWAGALAVPVLALLAARRARRHSSTHLHRAPVPDRERFAASSHLLCAMLLYALFFLVVAGIFSMLAASVSESDRSGIGFAAGIPVVALAWLAGFVTPGSSAGIGVREAVLIAALEDPLGAAAATLVALALRVVTTGGDVVFLFLGMVLRLTDRPPGPVVLGDDLA